MEKEKEIMKRIKENLKFLSHDIETLAESDVNITIQVGTNHKTVEFKEVKTLEVEVKATVNQEL